MLGPGDEHDRAVRLAGEGRHEHVQPNGESEGLVCLLSTEGNELLRRSRPDEDVAVGHLSHRHVRDQGPAVGAGHGDRERVRAGERLAALGVGEPRRRGGRQRRDEPVLGELPHPVAEVARREAARGGDQAGAGRRVEELRLDDPREDEIAERAVSLPALVAVLDDRALRRRSGIEVGQLGEPVEAQVPCPGRFRRSASSKWSASVRASASEKPSPRSRS